MKRNQWFVFAVIFLLATLYLFNLANGWIRVQTTTMEIYNKAMQNYLEKGGELPEYSEGYYISGLSARIYMSTAVITWSLFMACMICGFLEKKKKNERN